MNDENRELLSKVIQSRLETALDSNAEPEEAKLAYKEAIDAIDRQIEMEKAETSKSEQIQKEENRKKEAKWNNIFRWVEIGCVTLVTPIIAAIIDNRFADKVMRFEKSDSFTSTPGKTRISSIFRSRR